MAGFFLLRVGSTQAGGRRRKLDGRRTNLDAVAAARPEDGGDGATVGVWQAVAQLESGGGWRGHGWQNPREGSGIVGKTGVDREGKEATKHFFCVMGGIVRNSL